MTTPLPADPTASGKSSKAALGIIFLTVFIDLLGFGIVLPLLPRYGEYFQADGFQLGFLSASFSAMQFLFSPLWGRLSDRIGRRPVLVFGLASTAFFYLMFGLVTHWGVEGDILGFSPLFWLFVTRCGAGISGATISTAQAYIADCTGKSERGKGMALIGAAFGMGFTFGPLLGAMFVTNEADRAPTPSPAYAAAVLSGLAFLAALFLLPESLKAADRTNRRESTEAALWQRLVAAIAQPLTVILLLTSFVATFAFSIFETTLAILTERLGYGDRSNFLIFAFVGITLTLAQGLLVRRLLPRVGEFRMALCGILLMGVGLGGIALVGSLDNRTLLWFAMPLAVVGFAATTPSLQSLLSLSASKSEQGGTLGLGQSASALARICGPLVGQPLITVGIGLPYWVSTGLLAISLLIFLQIANRLPSKTDDSDIPLAH
jgi:MFS family permease